MKTEIGKTLTREWWTENTGDALEQRAESERAGQFLYTEQFNDDDRTQSDIGRYTQT